MTATIEALLRSEPVKVAGGGATEGPIWHPDGYLIFVRMNTKEVVRWDPDHGETVIREQSGKATGCTLDLDGHLVMCEADTRRVTRTYADGTVEALASEYEGRRLNQPNDLICDLDGAIYFTDPGSTLSEQERDLDFSGVYRLNVDGSLALVTDALQHPNGLALSGDGSHLYVANSRAGPGCDEAIKHGEICTHRALYASERAGESWSPAASFISLASSGHGVPDGVKVDADGRIYCGCAGAIWVSTPSGEHIGKITLPESPARNFAFGGEAHSTLFVAAGLSIYKLEMTVTGLPGSPFRR